MLTVSFKKEFCKNSLTNLTDDQINVQVQDNKETFEKWIT